MIKIGITGSNGLIGYHLRVFLQNVENIELKLANRETFKSEDALLKFCEDLDVIVHLADKNVGADEDIRDINMNISKSLTTSCDSAASKPHLIFASSTHIKLNPNAAYSISKKECSSYLEQWCKNRESPFTNLVIPHVFGEFGKPFYNSVISSFCYQITNNEETKIIKDKELNLLHAHDVAKGIYNIILEKKTGEQHLEGLLINVSEARDKLIQLSNSYKNNIIPNVEKKIDSQLFNTYRSYLDEGYYPRKFTLHSDDRGSLFEAMKTEQYGLTFASTTKPGVTRGNHYHIDKFERFIVINGNAEVRLRKIFSDEVTTYDVSGDNPTYIDIPTYLTHNITNTGSSDLITLFWSNVFYDENNPDTYFEEV